MYVCSGLGCRVQGNIENIYIYIYICLSLSIYIYIYRPAYQYKNNDMGQRSCTSMFRTVCKTTYMHIYICIYTSIVCHVMLYRKEVDNSIWPSAHKQLQLGTIKGLGFRA